MNPARATWRIGVAALALALALAFCGCAGYRLGPTNGLSAGARTIQVTPFQNDTMEPRLGEPVTQALRKSLQQDGTYRLNTSGDADIIVTGVITDFNRSPISYQPNDVVSVQDYALTMTAKIKATERATGKVLLERSVFGRTTIRVGSDLSNSERQAASLLAEDLARRATMCLVDGAW